MTKKLPTHLHNLRDYLTQPSERNEDLALTFFRSLFGNTFKRQSDAKNADGYVPGHFVLELKGDTNDWYAALYQGLAYQLKGLDFSLVVVVAKNFLAIWDVKDIPQDIRTELSKQIAAPNVIGRTLARRFSKRRKELLKAAIWNRPELSDMFLSRDDIFCEAMRSFEKTLKGRKRVRQAITLKNFVGILRDLKQFFDSEEPLKTVRAFYSMIYGPWDDGSVVMLNQKHSDRATLGGAEISHLIPSRRPAFKEFVENFAIHLKEGENEDDFFAHYDEALDVIDKKFRVKNGIFFTDLSLSKFVMWLVKQQIPGLGRNYLVIDPACGSGNLVTNWRSPLELRHKVVSEIEPELLFAVEQRMKGDQWHNGKYTVVPKVSENKGLNFLNISAGDYLQVLRDHLIEKGHKPDRPLAFLCNPPYRSDDDQAADSVPYKVHKTIIDLIGTDASSERYCCFLAQMKLLCDAAVESGLPEESVLLVFTKAAWLSPRPIFKQVRHSILGAFEDVGSILVNGKEFFDVKAQFPVAFTMWRYRPRGVKLDPNRTIPFLDLTWVKRTDLESIAWNESSKVDEACGKIMKNEQSRVVFYGYSGPNIKEASGLKRIDFQREKRKDEIGDPHFVCGLPKGDPRHERKKTLGEKDGGYIGFMDDLTPCRIKRDPGVGPWFRLPNQFMDVRKARCLSGPPDHYGYNAIDLNSADLSFRWYAISRLFVTFGYPIWADALELWPMNILHPLADTIRAYSFALAFAENECVEIGYPANNPIRGVPELYLGNPLSPLNTQSFWNRVMKPAINLSEVKTAKRLINTVNDLYKLWGQQFRRRPEIVATFNKPYFIGEGTITPGAGLIQIKDYSLEIQNSELKDALLQVQSDLKTMKLEFHSFVLSEKGLNYFVPTQSDLNRQIIPFMPKRKSIKTKKMAA